MKSSVKSLARLRRVMDVSALMVAAVGIGTGGCMSAPQGRGAMGASAPQSGLQALPASKRHAAGPPNPGSAERKPEAMSDLERLAVEQADRLKELLDSGAIKPGEGEVPAAVLPAARTQAPAKLSPVPSSLSTQAPVGRAIHASPLREPPPNPGANPGSNPAATPPSNVQPISSGLGSLGVSPRASQGNSTPHIGIQSPPLAPAPPVSNDERVNSAADELAGALRERLVTSKEPSGELLTLAWLDALRPGVLGVIDADSRIDPAQGKSIGVLRDIAATLSRSPSLADNPVNFWNAITRAAEPVLSTRDMNIASAVLCSKVEGFGQYTPIQTTTLGAGVPHAIIVYAELEGFGTRRTREQDGERFGVELSLAVEIWQDADRPTLQKRWSESSITDVSRRHRRDFFLTQVIELPPNLSVGAYNLKVTVHDRVKQGIAEQVIPIRIVSDPAVATIGG